MKVIKRITGKEGATLKKARDELVKITEGVIANGQAMQAELELLEGKPSLVRGLAR